jgi:hypothetical protein
MYKRFILLLGMFLGSHMPVTAQTPVPQIVLAQQHVVQIMTMHRAGATLTVAHFRLSQGPGEPPARFSLLFVGAYDRDPSLEHLSAMDEVKTLTLTQSSLPLIQLWGGRLELGAFQSTLHLQILQLGPLGYGGMQDFRSPRQGFPGGPGSVHSSGLSLSFHFGRDSRARRPTRVWRRMTQFVGAVLN